VTETTEVAEVETAAETSAGISNSADIKAGMARANEQRRRWTASVAAGEITFAYLVDKSYGEPALARIRLLHILAGRPDWNEVTAVEALTHQGFAVKDTIQSIRKSGVKTALFGRMLEFPPDQWRPRPDMPAGWPWFGRMSALLTTVGAPYPRELVDLLDNTTDPETGEERRLTQVEQLAALTLLLDGDGDQDG